MEVPKSLIKGILRQRAVKNQIQVKSTMSSHNRPLQVKFQKKEKMFQQSIQIHQMKMKTKIKMNLISCQTNLSTIIY